MYTVLYERNPLRHTRIIALLRFTQSIRHCALCTVHYDTAHIAH